MNHKLTTNDQRLTTKLPKPLPLQPEELEVLSPRTKLSVSEWAEQKRILPKKTSKISGPWRNELAPYAAEIMNALSDVMTREVWVKKSAQSAGTAIGENWLGQTIDEDPAPMAIVMPTENDVKKMMRTRIRPMFQSTPTLLKHLSGNDINNLRIGQETELDNMFLYIMWAGSASAMASVSLQKMMLDEAAKYKEETGGEAGAVDLARDRLTTYSTTSKLYAPSTPVLTGDAHDVEYSDTDQREYWVQCVHCKQRYIHRWEPAYVKLEKDSARNLLSPKDYLYGDCAHWTCPECGKRLTEKQRWEGVEAGKWAPRDCKVDSDGRIIGKVFSNPRKGYHISSFLVYPGFITANQLAYEWARADIAWKAGYKRPKQNFINSRCGDSWEEREKVTDEKIVIAHIGSYEPEVIPEGVQMLTAGVDVQMDHFWLMVLGWGYLSEVWTIYEARIDTGDTLELGNYEILRHYLNATWPVKDKSEVMGRLSKIGIDYNYRKETVMDFCRQCTELPIIPVGGDDSVKARVYRVADERGLKRYDLNVNNLKNRLYYLLFESKKPGPGYFHLHKETSEEVIKHLTSEERRIVYPKNSKKPKNKWVPKTEKAANHLWDCAIYAMFAAEIAGATMLRDPAMIKPRPKQEIKKEGIRKIRTKY